MRVRTATVAVIGAALALAGCGRGGGAGGPVRLGPLSPIEARAEAINKAGAGTGAPAKGAVYDPAALKLEVLLDRARFSPGAIDGKSSDNLHRAITAYQQAGGLGPDGAPTKAVWSRLTKADPRPAVKLYVIDADDVAGPFTPRIPADFAGEAGLEQLGYRTPAEELAESFHMDVALLRALNPGADFHPGSTVIVADRGGDDLGHDLGLIRVSRKDGLVRAFGADGMLAAAYPASIGSRSCPAATGTLEVKGIEAQPTYSYDSDSAGVAGAVRGRTEIAPGPNNPIGVVWISLSRDGYGLHGSAGASEVGKPSTHGCVSLTNWDARELARGVHPGLKVVFE